MADEEKKPAAKAVESKPKPKTVKVGDVLSKDGPSKDKPEAKSKDSKKKKVQHKHTHIEHHFDESGKPSGHTVRHTPKGGGDEVSYAAPDLNAVKSGLDQHVGEAASPDMMAAAGPAAEPAPEPAPAPAQAAPQPV